MARDFLIRYNMKSMSYDIKVDNQGKKISLDVFKEIDPVKEAFNKFVGAELKRNYLKITDGPEANVVGVSIIYSNKVGTISSNKLSEEENCEALRFILFRAVKKISSDSKLRPIVKTIKLEVIGEPKIANAKEKRKFIIEYSKRDNEVELWIEKSPKEFSLDSLDEYKVICQIFFGFLLSELKKHKLYAKDYTIFQDKACNLNLPELHLNTFKIIKAEDNNFSDVKNTGNVQMVLAQAKNKLSSHPLVKTVELKI